MLPLELCVPLSAGLSFRGVQRSLSVSLLSVLLRLRLLRRLLVGHDGKTEKMPPLDSVRGVFRSFRGFCGKSSNDDCVFTVMVENIGVTVRYRGDGPQNGGPCHQLHDSHHSFRVCVRASSSRFNSTVLLPLHHSVYHSIYLSIYLFACAGFTEPTGASPSPSPPSSSLFRVSVSVPVAVVDAFRSLSGACPATG